MATVYVSMGRIGTRGPEPVMVYQSVGLRSETITSGVSAVSGALAGNGGNKGTADEVAQVFCASAIYATSDGTASATNGLYVPANTLAFVAVPAGATVSVIDA